MFWIIAAVIAALMMLVSMSKRAEEDEDPVYLAFLDVIGLCDEIARWETNLWSLWTMAVVENLMCRLDEDERILYLNKLEGQIFWLQVDALEKQPMSESFPYFAEKTNDLQTH